MIIRTLNQKIIQCVSNMVEFLNGPGDNYRGRVILNLDQEEPKEIRNLANSVAIATRITGHDEIGTFATFSEGAAIGALSQPSDTVLISISQGTATEGVNFWMTISLKDAYTLVTFLTAYLARRTEREGAK